MYIGSTDQRGLHHLILEILYNSVDEAVAGYCNQIVLTLCHDDKILVVDNGRGIPVEIHPDSGSQRWNSNDYPSRRCKVRGRSYTVSGGLHGVGASVVNALSSWMRVESKRERKLYSQEYCRGIPQSEVKSCGEASGSGTATTFIPDKEVFGDFNYDFDLLAQRLRN